MHKLFFQIPDFRRRLLEQTPEEIAKAGGGGTGNEPPAPPAPEPPAPPAPPAIDPAEFARLKVENERLAKIRDAASQHVEIDEATGEVRPKVVLPKAEPTQDELDRMQMANEVTQQAVQVMELNRKAEQKIMDNWKAKDPLFSSNYQKAREMMEKLPPAQRTEKVWERAYNIARGENIAAYEEHYRKEGEIKAREEISRASGGALPTGGGAGGGAPEGKVDLSKIVLTPQQMAAAQQMVAHGMLKSVDEYKENLVYLQGAEVSR